MRSITRALTVAAGLAAAVALAGCQPGHPNTRAGHPELLVPG